MQAPSHTWLAARKHCTWSPARTECRGCSCLFAARIGTCIYSISGQKSTTVLMHSTFYLSSHTVKGMHTVSPPLPQLLSWYSFIPHTVQSTHTLSLSLYFAYVSACAHMSIHLSLSLSHSISYTWSEAYLVLDPSTNKYCTPDLALLNGLHTSGFTRNPSPSSTGSCST